MGTDTRAKPVSKVKGLARPRRAYSGLAVACLAAAVIPAISGYEAGAQQPLAQPQHAQAQQPPAQLPQANPDWQTGTQVERKAGPAPKGNPAAGATGGGWNAPGNVTVIPRSAPEKAPPSGEISLSALLTDDGMPIEQGLVWRAFQAPPSSAAKDAQAKPKLVGSWRDATPTVRLPPGEYLINASFGRAHLTRKVNLAAGQSLKEQFVLNAGGLKVNTLLANGEQVPAGAVSFDVYGGDSDPSNSGARIIGQAKPGLIVRLNAGVYKVVSTYGDANSIVRADVTVDAGKLSEATITHHAAKVTLKLVTRPGGEAIADTTWTLQTAQNELVRESMGALPSHILAAGNYVAIAKSGGKSYRREFSVNAGEPVQVEVIVK